MYWNKLPVDVWWLILKKLWEDYPNFNIQRYSHPETPFTSSNVCKNMRIMGKHVTSDLFIMRRLCKTTKRMVDKYTKRHLSLSRRYLINFRYEK